MLFIKIKEEEANKPAMTLRQAAADQGGDPEMPKPAVPQTTPRVWGPTGLGRGRGSGFRQATEG